jgi:hypothetical protein
MSKQAKATDEEGEALYRDFKRRTALAVRLAAAIGTRAGGGLSNLSLADRAWDLLEAIETVGEDRMLERRARGETE